MDLCVKFNYSETDQCKAWDVSSSQPILRNESAWCNYTSTKISRSANVPLLLPVKCVCVCITEFGPVDHEAVLAGAAAHD